MANLNVLVIEDLKTWQSVFKTLLKKIDENVNITPAYNQADAGMYFEHNTYDLIILDLKVPLDEFDKTPRPGINLRLLEKIRQSARNKFCGIIITSAHGDIPIVKEALRGRNKVYNFFEKKGKFDNSGFIQSSKEAILASRLWKLEERKFTRYHLTIHLSGDSIIGCEVDGPDFRASQMLDRPVRFDSSDFAQRSDNLNVIFSVKEWSEQWREQAKLIGKNIYDALFQERKFLENLYTAQAKAKSADDLWIRLNGSPDTLGVPFELIHNNSYYLSQRHIFSRSLTGYRIPNKKPFHLFIEDLQERDKTLKVLIVASNSNNALPRVENELRLVRNEITTSLNHIGIRFKIDCLFTEEASYEKVSAALKSGNYHIFHFCGHADFTSEFPENSGIWLLDECGAPKKLNAASLNLLMQNSSLQFVFLSCCLSAATKDGVGRGDFYGIYEALVRAEIPAILGYRWTLLDESALHFAGIFYRELWKRLSLGEALHKAKNETALELGLDDETWVSPVLLMQNY